MVARLFSLAKYVHFVAALTWIQGKWRRAKKLKRDRRRRREGIFKDDSEIACPIESQTIWKFVREFWLYKGGYGRRWRRARRKRRRRTQSRVEQRRIFLVALGNNGPPSDLQSGSRFYFQIKLFSPFRVRLMLFRQWARLIGDLLRGYLFTRRAYFYQHFFLINTKNTGVYFYYYTCHVDR